MEWNERRLGRHLNLRDLNVLLTVVRCGSMGKAAAQLSVSQPAISKAIADMEYALGVRLLDRSQRGVEPTVYGRALLDRGVNAFDELKQAVRHIAFLADPAAGEVRLGATVIVASSIVAAVVDRLSRRYPRVNVHLLAAEAAMIYRALEQRDVEVLVAGIFGPAAEDHMNAEILYDDPFVVAAGGLDPPRAALLTSSMPARNALLASGRFLTLIPTSVVRLTGRNQEIKALPVDIPTVGRPVGILTLKGRTLSPVAQLFIAVAREVAASIAGRVRGRKA
jgi:DNA-binding transcriptional LysR family regulator